MTITGGQSPFGGGILNSSGTLTVVNSTISDNIASFDGGGIFNDFGTAEVMNSTIVRQLGG
ncbi:MAG: hypothetical protein KIS87_04755 [Phycisphaeraceae bacterium]|nr:hypothetical protein [Phycisphaeraceae bacterium]